ncbi:prepilin peptidase [Georgenia subflava]|uniref:Prepilin peptidase n=1 Tax=Georgenia subflava TaxID=1622177 RepID=A0A6N7EKQ0_9MICO|nr:A24 family peptidase [Georgenia subflava]MPV38001.1 prepilin peptidase [Georgenia subflava]
MPAEPAKKVDTSAEVPAKKVDTSAERVDTAAEAAAEKVGTAAEAPAKKVGISAAAPGRARVRANLRPLDGAIALLLMILAAVGLTGQPWSVVLTGAALTAAATLLAVIDVRTHRLPDRLVLVGLAIVAVGLTLAAVLTGGWPALGRAGLAGAVSGLVYLALALLRTGGLGLGDVKVGAVVGVWLGWFGWTAVVAGVLATFILGGVFAAVLLLTRRAHRRSAVALGPWLFLGAAAATALHIGGHLLH